jgi:hypothetical protein
MCHTSKSAHCSLSRAVHPSRNRRRDYKLSSAFEKILFDPLFSFARKLLRSLQFANFRAFSLQWLSEQQLWIRKHQNQSFSFFFVANSTQMFILTLRDER